MPDRADVLSLLEPLEPAVHALPPRRDEVDEQGEIVDARMTLGEEIAFEPLQPAHGLIQQPPDLGDVPCHGQHLVAQTVADSRSDSLWQGTFELGCCLGKSLDLRSRPGERSLQLRWADSTRRRLRDPRLGPLERLVVHGRKVTLRIGWSRMSSSTSCLGS